MNQDWPWFNYIEAVLKVYSQVYSLLLFMFKFFCNKKILNVKFISIYIRWVMFNLLEENTSQLSRISYMEISSIK